jgi:hypothetical protein
MKNVKRLKLVSQVIRSLSSVALAAAHGGVAQSGSQVGGSATCPPPKNGEGSGCVTG